MTDYNTTEQTGNYYDEYTSEMLLGARKTFSRYNLGIFACIIISYAASFIAQIVLLILLGNDNYIALFDNIYIRWFFGVGPMYLLGIPALYLIVRNMKRAKREKKSLSIRDFLGYFVIAQGFMLVGNYIGVFTSSMMEKFLGIPVTNTTSELVENSPKWLIILIVVFIGPILEELVFRKLMIDRLSRYGDAIAITVSAVAFGLFHGNFYQFFYTAMFGALLGYMYTKTGNAIYNTVMHMLVNFFGSIVSLFIFEYANEFIDLLSSLNAGNEIDVRKFFQLAMLITSYEVIQHVIAAGGIILFIVLLKNNTIKVSPICEYNIPKEKRVQTVLLNVGTILFLILTVAVFAMDILLA